MKNVFFYLLLGFSLIACCKKSFNSDAYIKNQINEEIRIKSYRNGLVNNDSFLLEPFKVINLSAISNDSEFAFFSSDSVEVTFIGNKKAVHYTYDSAKRGNNLNGIHFRNPRNIFNKANYSINKTEDTKCYSKTEEYYSFTEADLL